MIRKKMERNDDSKKSHYALDLNRFVFRFSFTGGYRTSMTKPSDPSVPFPDNDTARTHRQLRFVKALFKIDDPEVEEALTAIVERLAAASQKADPLPPPAPEGPRPKPPLE
jgi:hypothetical protein